MRVAAYQCFQLELAIDSNTLRLRLWPDFVDSIVCNLREIELHQMCRLSRFRTRQLDQIACQRKRSTRENLNPGERAAIGMCIAMRFHQSQDRGERRAQVMGHIT